MHDASSPIAERLRRGLPSPRTIDAHDTARAAVILVLFDRDGHAHTLLTRRADTLTHHPGQISLPGGRRDPEDADLAATARRELTEELAIPPDAIDIVGRLDDVETLASGFVVAPFIALATEPIIPEPNPIEIARVMEVSVRDILAADAALAPGVDGLALRYPLDGEDVWGATARILRAFAAALRATL
jgi:8-oxo-dGTP pyrophosphatase MutT (NUDIX family)